MTTPHRWIGVGLVLAFATRANAQGIVGPPPTPAECNAAVTALGSGQHPDGRGWERLGSCPAVGPAALSNAVTGARLSTDSVYLKTLLAVAGNLQSVSIFHAGREVAIDQTASTPARVAATLLVLRQYNSSLSAPLGRSWQSLTTVPWGSYCFFGSSGLGNYAAVQSTPAPSDLQTAAANFQAVAANPGSTAVVRDLARCARQALVPAVPEVVNPSELSLAYVCANKFRVTNAGSVWADVTYKVVDITEQGDLTVPPNGSKDFIVVSSGQVQLIFQSQVVQQVPNGGTTCPP